jgi:hypothetical protein
MDVRHGFCRHLQRHGLPKGVTERGALDFLLFAMEPSLS